MSAAKHPTWDWRGTPSECGDALGRTQRAPKTKPKPITESKKKKIADELQRGSMR